MLPMQKIDNSTKGEIDFSWIETYTLYYEAYRNMTSENESAFKSLEKYLKLIDKLVKSGYLGQFRLGTSMYRLILSRSIKHNLRPDQRMIMFYITKEMIRLTHNLRDVGVKESVDLRDFEYLTVYVDKLLEFPLD